VAQAEQGRLFSPFYSTTGRAGLGLCLAARAARTQGGAVALRPDERPHGATFTLSLRAAEAPRSGPGGF
jgi:C4-dicarboxylate-specific signal transduction histidine kinase